MALQDLKEKIMELEIKINKIEVITDPIVRFLFFSSFWRFFWY